MYDGPDGDTCERPEHDSDHRNARVSGDGGVSVYVAAMGSLLTSMVGIGWSKDNVKTQRRMVGGWATDQDLDSRNSK